MMCVQNGWWTPLHEAASNGHPGAVEVLVAAGADVNTSGTVSYILHYIFEVCAYYLKVLWNYVRVGK